jgi:hypothetical protein
MSIFFQVLRYAYQTQVGITSLLHSLTQAVESGRSSRTAQRASLRSGRTANQRYSRSVATNRTISRPCHKRPYLSWAMIDGFFLKKEILGCHLPIPFPIYLSGSTKRSPLLPKASSRSDPEAAAVKKVESLDKAIALLTGQKVYWWVLKIIRTVKCASFPFL